MLVHEHVFVPYLAYVRGAALNQIEPSQDMTVSWYLLKLAPPITHSFPPKEMALAPRITEGNFV